MVENTMKVVLYARVSSDKQAEKDLSIPAQLKQMCEYCRSKGWLIMDQYIDEAESARTANRPKFQAMIAAAKSKTKEFDAILVWNVVRIPNAVPQLISKETSDLVQTQIKERSPSLVHPRSVSSAYLLAGLLRCGPCDRVMQGGTAKSGRYRYYTCYNRLTKGKTACSSRSLPQVIIEDAVLARIRDHILTEENLKNLTAMVNEEIRQSRAHSESLRVQLTAQIAEKQKRLDRLFDLLETGHFDVADLAPRVKKLKEEIDNLNLKNRGLPKDVCELTLTEREIADAVRSLRQILNRGTTPQRKQFLR